MTRTMLAALCLCGFLTAQDHDHHDAVNQRGDHVMGFSHAKTTHHFLLWENGGAIDVIAKDPKDTESRDQIRGHLGHIAKMFASGDFNAPFIIHAKEPPGVPVLRRLNDSIQYRYELIDSGARVRILTANSEARKAVHEFLRFQIEDHQTHDPLEIKPAPALP